jgi:fructokinase
VIVVAGEALIDLVLRPSGELSGHPGGGPFNAARTIGRLEQPVSYLGRVSTDRFGERLGEELSADGVSLEATIATDDPTTLALAEIDEAGAARYRFYFDGTSAPGLTLQEARAALPAMDALLVGTLGLVFEPMATTLEAVIDEVGDETLVALDPNCRPSTIRDPAAYRARLSRVLGRSDLVKASDQDLEWLEPGRDPVDAARVLLDDGPPLALVTRGGDGALVVTPGDVIQVPAPPVDVVDTIGAGDAFAGGFLARWQQRGHGRAELADRDAVVDATSFACTVAAITCSRAGAVPPRLAELS